MDIVAAVAPNLTHFIPGNWSGQISSNADIITVNSTFVGSTIVSDAEVNSTFTQAASAAFISYSDEFSDLLGPKPEIRLLDDRPGEYFAFESGPWIPDRNEFWFTSSIYTPPGNLSILHLDTGEITRPNTTDGWINFQRGVYSSADELVYMSSYRDNGTFQGGLVTIDPETYQVLPMANSFYGLPFSGLNDVTMLRRDSNETYLFLSDTDFLIQGYPTGLAPAQMYSGLYRWDVIRGELLPAVSRITQPGLNAAKLGPGLKTLFISDSTAGVAADGPPSHYSIWKYDIDNTELMPVNPRLFATPRFFIDGLQVDDAGRVWSAEGDGIVVRNPRGATLGVINKLYFANEVQFANVGLCGDVLVVLAANRLWTVKLAQTIITKDSRHIFG